MLSAETASALGVTVAIMALARFFLRQKRRSLAAKQQPFSMQSPMKMGAQDEGSSDPFAVAQAEVARMRNELPMKQRLRLYSYYKQALFGDAPDSISAWASVVDRTKHASWSRRKGMAKAAVCVLGLGFGLAGVSDVDVAVPLPVS